MVLELHILGPAFSLPSIDPECLAAVAYCAHAVPRAQWVLMASGERLRKELPALRNESIWIDGFGNIVDYLREYSDGEWDLDGELEAQEKADCIAFSTFIRTHLSPLLDLSLYISSHNYPTTRHALSPLLPWPTQYLSPPTLRSAAKARTSHLALSALDLDSLCDDQRNRASAGPGSDQIPQSLRKPIPTVTSALKQGEHASRFRLEALMEAAFAPLQQLLGDGKRFFFAADSHPSALDCLALAYLALALIPELPHPWLKQGLERRYAGLCDYARREMEALGWRDVAPEDALRDTTGSKKTLPWQKPPPNPPLLSAGTIIFDHALSSLPFRSTPIIPAATAPDPASDAHPAPNAPPPHFPPHILSLTGAAVAALGASLLYSGLLPSPPSRASKRNLSDLGEAGAMLAMAGFREDVREAQVERALDGGEKVGVVEVDVAVGDRRGRDRVA